MRRYQRASPAALRTAAPSVQMHPPYIFKKEQTARKTAGEEKVGKSRKRLRARETAGSRVAHHGDEGPEQGHGEEGERERRPQKHSLQEFAVHAVGAAPRAEAAKAEPP